MDAQTALFLGVLALWAYLMYRRVAGKVAPEAAKELVQEGALLVDVRTAPEYESGHIAGAINVPLQELEQRKQELGDPTKPVVLYCRSGARSSAATSILRRSGFQQVNDLGAMRRWPKSSN